MQKETCVKTESDAGALQISQGETLESEGLGDTIEKVLSKFGISEEKISKILGGSGCGCSKRKKWFNKIFSYKKESDNE